MKIQMLNNLDKQLIKNEILEKYDVIVNNNQIKSQIIDHMECEIEFEIDSETLNLKGTVQNYDRNPLEVWFNYKQDARENQLFQKFLIEKSSQNLMVSCVTKSKIGRAHV